MLKSAVVRSFLRAFSSSKVIEAPKKYSETISKARAVMKLYDLQPFFISDSFVAPNATIVGDVFIGNQVNIGHGAVIRGDINSVQYLSNNHRLHRNVFIGDNCVLHTAASLPTGIPAILII